MLQQTERLRLRFDRELEKEFREEYYAKSLHSLRMSLALGAVIYGFFGILDIWIFPATSSTVWAIRFGIAVPAILACLLFTYAPSFPRYMQPAVAATVVLGGLGVISFMVIVRSPINYIHNAGLMLILMYVFTFSKLRFSYTAAAAWLIVLAYNGAAIGIMRTPFSVLLNDNFLFFSANIIGMFSLFHRERYMRRDFLYNRRVRDLEEERHVLEREKILRELHDVLGTITTNIRLLAEMAQGYSSGDEIRKTLSIISGLSQEGLAEIKGFMQSLDAREITWQALADELRASGRGLVEPHGVGFTMTAAFENAPGRPASLLWLNLQRIYKEALTNVVKHAGARNVSVSLEAAAGSVALTVRDDGSGIKNRASGGRGLSNMRRRAEDIGGTLTCSADNGTVVRVHLPLPIRSGGKPETPQVTNGGGDP